MDRSEIKYKTINKTKGKENQSFSLYESMILDT